MNCQNCDETIIKLNGKWWHIGEEESNCLHLQKQTNICDEPKPRGTEE